MSWWNNIAIRSPLSIKKGTTTLDNTSTRMEIDVFGISSNEKKMFYSENYNFFKLYKNNFVVRDAISLIARKFSGAEFIDLEKENSKLLEKIKYPNGFQSREEFLNDFCINILCSGYTVVWNKYASYGVFDSLEWIVLTTDTDLTSFGENTIKTVVRGKPETISYDDVIIFYDSQRQTDSLKGFPRIVPFRSQIRNIEAAQKAKDIQIHNSGTTIVSPKSSSQGQVDDGLDKPIISIEGLKTQKEEMEEKLNSRGMDNRIIISSKGVDAKNLSAELNSMKFSDLVEPDILAIYNVFGVPVELTPYGKNATFDNKETAENSLIESEIQPLIKSLCESLNWEFSNYGKISGNYNHFNSVSKTKNEIHKTNKEIATTYRELFSAGLIDEKEAKELLSKHGVI